MNRSEALRNPEAAALDLGSTRIKAGTIDERGHLCEVRTVPAPPLGGAGGRREGDGLAYASAAEQLLERVSPGPGENRRLGIASQRSTFLLWERNGGRPVLPMISWQDRRAAGWCRERRELDELVTGLTGLPLTPHYVAPKLAVVRAEHPDVWRRVEAGQVLFGTLETFLLWRWSGGRAHETDLTMAARTLLVDLALGDWSPLLLERFAIPRDLLPRVGATFGRSVALPGGVRCTASIADQAAGALVEIGEAPGSTLVNLGTGVFVLRGAAGSEVRRRGYLTAPVLATPEGDCRFVLEGTINGGGATLDRLGGPPDVWPDGDPSPEAFCLPDAAGLGSPHWRSDLGLLFSCPADELGPAGRRRVALEGLLFRIVEILEDLGLAAEDPPLRVAGGVSTRPVVVSGLAALLQRPVERAAHAESTLLGAARLAAGIPARDASAAEEVVLPDEASYLVEKYRRWKLWLHELLAR